LTISSELGLLGGCAPQNISADTPMPLIESVS
jgi:hypothetical protein